MGEDGEKGVQDNRGQEGYRRRERKGWDMRDLKGEEVGEIT